jgi:hypothetical protein
LETLITALLYSIKVRYLKPNRVEISMIPTWLGRRMRRSIRTGTAEKAKGRGRWPEIHWWWSATDRYVGDYIERYIEAAPIMSLEEMPVELLLQEGDGNDGR